MYKDGKITGAASIYDAQRALGNSGTYVSTLCEAGNINPWARYKPIAVPAGDTRNRPGALTLAEREALGWGVTLTTDVWAAEDPEYKIAGLLNGKVRTDGTVETAPTPFSQLIVRNAPWISDSQFRRLSDFTSHPGDDPQRTLGYFHNANGYVPSWNWKPGADAPAHTSGNGFTVTPLVKEGQRSIEIEGDAPFKLALHNDEYFLRGWFGRFGGTDAWSVSTKNRMNDKDANNAYVQKKETDPLSLSVIDAIVNAINVIHNTNSGYNLNPGYSTRGVMVFVRTNFQYTPVQGGLVYQVNWVHFGNMTMPMHPKLNSANLDDYADGRCYDETPSLNETSTNPAGGTDYYLDLQRSSANDAAITARKDADGVIRSPGYGFTGGTKLTWKELKGECIFVEYYTAPTTGGKLPIPLFVYKVNISRVASGLASDTVDIKDTVYFEFVFATRNGIVVRIYTRKNDVTSAGNLQSYLAGKYSALKLCVSTTKNGATELSPTINLLSGVSTSTSAYPHYTASSDLKPSGQATTYNSFLLVYEPDDLDITQPMAYWVIKATKKGGGSATLAADVDG